MDFLRCGVSKQAIGYGDYYYEDDEDGLIVKAKVYQELKEKKRLNDWDYTLLNNAQNQYEYGKTMRQMERDYFATTLFDRKVLGKDVIIK